MSEPNSCKSDTRLNTKVKTLDQINTEIYLPEIQYSFSINQEKSEFCIKSSKTFRNQ